ncbi:hypothetical protein [Microcoleus sp. herbarium5]|uniref:hypothetical protein n=1 Tax=Microcoleus sp. herbarium5 TaxID=3055434 RepID=UPI002FCFB93D
MIDLEYQQQCSRSRSGSNRYADYFYLRSADRVPCFFSGTWELPENHIFTAYRARYDKYEHLRLLKFLICRVGGNTRRIICRRESFDFDENNLYEDDISAYYIIGNFDVICAGIGLTYGKRLLEWWVNGNGSIEYAELCAKYLKPRIKEIPAFELEKLKVPQPQPTDAVLGGNSAFQKWLSTAAVLGGKISNDL